MKHKTWFRLVIKAIGVLLTAQSLVTLTHYGALLFQEVFLGGFGGMLHYALAGMLGGALQLMIGLHLFFGAAWIVNKAIPSNRPYCPECGYDISKSSSANCPECGVALPAQNGAMK